MQTDSAKLEEYAVLEGTELGEYSYQSLGEETRWADVQVPRGIYNNRFCK